MARHGVHSHSGEIQKSHVKVTCETQMSRLSRRTLRMHAPRILGRDGTVA